MGKQRTGKSNAISYVVVSPEGIELNRYGTSDPIRVLLDHQKQGFVVPSWMMPLLEHLADTTQADCGCHCCHRFVAAAESKLRAAISAGGFDV